MLIAQVLVEAFEERGLRSQDPRAVRTVSPGDFGKAATAVFA